MLNLKYDELLSSFAFNFNLRCYTKVKVGCFAGSHEVGYFHQIKGGAGHSALKTLSPRP